MERLTERIKRLQKDDLIVYTNGKYEDTIPAEMTNDDIRAVLKKLAAYEDLEEHGLLVRLPVPIGTIVYCIYTGITDKNATIFADYFNADMCKSWGKFVFATKEEAEKKLKEMKNNA